MRRSLPDVLVFGQTLDNLRVNYPPPGGLPWEARAIIHDHPAAVARSPLHFARAIYQLFPTSRRD